MLRVFQLGYMIGNFLSGRYTQRVGIDRMVLAGNVMTMGGGLSYCHPGMYGLFLLIEAVRQIRGECGDRQVKGAKTALAHGNGGVLSSQATVILGGAATL